MPTPPPELQANLAEGLRFPAGDAGARLDTWLKQMLPFEKIVEKGCNCKRYSDPFDKKGGLNLEATANSNKLIWNTGKSHHLRVKQLLAAGDLSMVFSEISKIIDVARTGNGGTRALVSYEAEYRIAIKQGLSTIRECLYWQSLPDSIANELVSLLQGLSDRTVAIRTVTAESNGLIAQLMVESDEKNFFQLKDSELAGESSNKKFMLMHFVNEHAKDFDPTATLKMLRAASFEASDNAGRKLAYRKTPLLNQLKEELAPLLEAFASAEESQQSLSVLSSKMAGIANVVGKILVLDSYERKLIVPIEMQDRLLLQVTGTEILIRINQFERTKHALPSSLDELVQLKFMESLDSERWTGYELQYSASDRTLAFALPNGGGFKNPQLKNELNWKIPKPELLI